MGEQDVEGQGGQRIAAWRVALKSFTSQWFLVPQGTGILSIILHNLHYHFHGLNIISQILWVITFITLIFFVCIYLVRIALYPRHVFTILSTDPQETACLSSISIAFTTIYAMIALNLLSWSLTWGMVAYVMFWINVVLTAVTTIGIPYILTYVEGPGIDGVAPSVFLPLISSLTLAAGGGVVCRYGELGANLQVPVIILSYIFLGMALPTSIAFDGVFMARLFDGAYPPQQKVYQIMILCGPPGQASFALQVLGNVVQRGAFASYDTSSFIGPSGASTIATTSEFLGLLYWGFGTFWWAFACLAILHYTIIAPKTLFKWDQSLASWSLVFPWGVYTNAAVQLGVVLNSRAFWVWSTVLALILVILWLGNAFASCFGVVTGKVLGLDKGWGGKYYTSSAEEEKEAQS
ncbi:Plasma membrane sulfite pump involved in sulfite metabolism [Recurvomyces mirabilis]|uniref:Plasma membrane sulfite pump involved in sulfite metabolism n=1 Tax=Recurvomyces mirabilis TaxID=574656 RepID=A0AAE0WX65_9PEZI|nr:Plasma membrane sulfite pump involved in sulfite metabolism [Recurvomyces mirabilis]KAK5161696.1 Plasma membrane sulfite pump involved in sulfite metabolism [Recurvomyces mirabilis]